MSRVELIREAAGEIALLSMAVQSATFLALTAGEKFADKQRHNDDLVVNNNYWRERAMTAEANFKEAAEVAERAVSKAEELHALSTYKENFK